MVQLGRFKDAENALLIAAEADEYRYRQMFISQARSLEIETGSSIYFLMASALARQQ